MEMQVDFSIFSYIFSKFRRECPQNFRKSEESTGVKAQKKHRPFRRCFSFCVLCVLYKNQLFLFWKHSLQ